MGNKFAVVGATGSVGREVLQVLSERGVKAADVVAMASDRSVGHQVSYGEDDVLTIASVDKVDFAALRVTILCADAQTARKLAPKIAKAGGWVIDTSAEFRLDPDVPLIVPEINREDIRLGAQRRIVASPSAAVVQMLLAVAPIYDRYGINRLTVTSLHSTSFAGRPAMDELFNQTKGIYVNTPTSDTREYFAKQIAFNVIPEVDGIGDGGSSGEEARVVSETCKTLDPEIAVQANSAWVPTFVGIGQFINLETDRPVDDDVLRGVLQESDFVALADHKVGEALPTMAEVAGEDMVFISRLRSSGTSTAMWVVADNIRLTALNVLQIADIILSDEA